MKILLVVNLCAHYRIKLFELLDKMYDIRFLFFSKGEKYYDGERYLGNFRGEYLWGFNIAPKIRVNPKLIFELINYSYTYLIVGISGTLPLFLSFIISKIRKKKFILWTGLWHHPRTFFHRITFPFVKFIYKHSDAILVYGNHVKEYLGSLGIDEKKIFIAQKATDNSLYNKSVSPDQIHSLKRSLNIEGKKVILFVGRLEKNKGIDYLIDALKKLGQKDVVLILIGKGNQKEHLENLVTANKMDNRIFFLDYIVNTRLYISYAIADIFVLCSITTKEFKEPWGMVINEAMNQGCPVVATDAVGAAAGGLVRNEINGFIVPEKNSDILKDALQRILNDEYLKNKMSISSKKIVNEYTTERKVAGFKNVVEYVSKLNHGDKELCGY